MCTSGGGRVGLRRRFKAPISSEARVRIPSFAFCTAHIYFSCATLYCVVWYFRQQKPWSVIKHGLAIRFLAPTSGQSLLLSESPAKKKCIVLSSKSESEDSLVIIIRWFIRGSPARPGQWLQGQDSGFDARLSGSLGRAAYLRSNRALASSSSTVTVTAEPYFCWIRCKFRFFSSFTTDQSKNQYQFNHQLIFL